MAKYPIPATFRIHMDFIGEIDPAIAPLDGHTCTLQDFAHGYYLVQFGANPVLHKIRPRHIDGGIDLQEVA